MIAVSEMRDGIITFESEGDAQRFSALLEADGHLEVSGTGPVLTCIIDLCVHYAALHLSEMVRLLVLVPVVWVD